VHTDHSIDLHHASNHEVPRIFYHLSHLWDRALAPVALAKRLSGIAEFEWWFMTTNVTARSGAGIGDALSLVLQRMHGLPIRNAYQRLDFEVLWRTPEDYLDWRST
jgi:hypothetical protein